MRYKTLDRVPKLQIDARNAETAKAWVPRTHGAGSAHWRGQEHRTWWFRRSNIPSRKQVSSGKKAQGYQEERRVHGTLDTYKGAKEVRPGRCSENLEQRTSQNTPRQGGQRDREKRMKAAEEVMMREDG